MQGGQQLAASTLQLITSFGVLFIHCKDFRLMVDYICISFVSEIFLGKLDVDETSNNWLL